ncbi:MULTISPECIES: sigma-70 family RNA polymerase sigma factor [unclassified Ruminococcus]|uniref:sigma-70 family RNA polymerase sigma factor n=1 Tax=unclassified Ruminococcus TaxID=2608920 RepID=UPI00210CB91C|nr:MULTISPECIES: sigma-70 family RNA polymerase sigma factor [unclassified Ruminococcus]MCQ4022938.1 sigma-70 family RNA polymerase sigma factor [Ruminococcus sp. zg-924]MCQ4115364.1 sigma-70 family RNA polymerase sigma factor [Ruminococcus sp. zg-921]
MNERERFISKNTGLVHSCAARFKNRGIEYEDLYSAGCIGLIKAYDRFDPSLGYKFSTYAVPLILGEIKGLFRSGGAVKVSRRIKELSIKVIKEQQKYIALHGESPSVTILAQLLGESEELITQAVSSNVQVLSLSSCDNDENGREIDLPVESHDTSLTEILSLRQAISELPENDRELIKLRYFKNKTQSQTAKELNMTQVQVSRREKKIMAVMREKLTV